jgi:hypothetical protein
MLIGALRSRRAELARLRLLRRVHAAIGRALDWLLRRLDPDRPKR